MQLNTVKFHFEENPQHADFNIFKKNSDEKKHEQAALGVVSKFSLVDPNPAKTAIPSTITKSCKHIGITGGTTTVPCRDVHLILFLASLIDKTPHSPQSRPHSEVAILGPGAMRATSEIGFSSPSFHEIAHAFPPTTKLTVVDIQEYVLNIGLSTYGPEQRLIGQSILRNPHNVERLNEEGIKSVKQYLRDIPEKVTQENLILCHQSFQEFKPKKYDVVFALHSLFYALDELKNDRKLFLEQVAKYLGSLTTNGRLLIDVHGYKLMGLHLSLPDVEEELTSVRWHYGKQKNPFSIMRVMMSQESETSHNWVRLMTQDGTKMQLFTNDFFVIRRLPAEASQSQR